MAKSLETAAAAPPANTDLCLPEDLLYLDFPCPPNLQNAGAAATHNQSFMLQDLLDSSVDALTDLGPIEGEAEEEELEWLSNKDAFPSLEMAFAISSPSRSSGGAAGELMSPVSVLGAAARFCAPARPRSKGRRRRRKVMTGLEIFPATAAALRTVAAVERRRCRHCESTETPQWRTGPDGPKTLCNACGVRFKSGRLLPEYRPASSPTFSAVLHSNSHRRVLEMRRGKVGNVRKGSSSLSSEKSSL